MKKFLTLFVLFSIISGSINAQIDVASFDIVTVCPNSYGQSIAVDNIIFTPNTPGDSVFISDITIDPNEIQSYSYSNLSGKSIIRVEPVYGFSGSSILNVEIVSDAQDTLYYSFQVEVTEAPVFTLLQNELCESENQVRLNSLISPGGGNFTFYPMEHNAGANDFINIQQMKDEFGSSFTQFNFDYFYIDTNGCEHVTYESIPLKEAPLITLDNVQHTSCGNTDGSIDISVFSTLSYQGIWNNGTTNESISGLSSGEYTYTAINTEGCSAQKTVNVETSDLLITATIDNVKCKGGKSGEIEIDITGGSGNYRTIWLSGNNTNTISDLKAGNYTVNVTDLDNGCESVKTFSVTEPSDQFSFYYGDNQLPTDCTSDDGKIADFIPDYGVSPYTFEWSTGETTEDIENLSQGQYSLTVTDVLGCKASNTWWMYASDAPTIDYDITDPACNENNGEIEITNLFPSPNATITSVEWYNGDTTMFLNGLSAGEYEVTIEQDNGCSSEFIIDVENTNFNYDAEICIVTVDTTTNTNLVVWEKEFSNPQNIDYYKIYRGNPTGSGFDYVDSVDFDNISVFNDVIASPETRSWTYLISAVNECGVESNVSEKHKTIHLVMNDGQSQDEKILSWDNYEGLDYFTYALHRGTDVDGWQTVDGNIAVTDFPTYTDILPAGATEVDYIIEVIPTSGGCTATFGKAQDYNSSRSNRPSPIFNPGDGTGDPNNGFGDGTTDVVEFENTDFSALVYPNPSNGNFTLAIDGNDTDEELKLSIVSINGKIIYQDKINNNLNDFHLNAQPGVYFVKLQTKKMTETIRIVIQ